MLTPQPGRERDRSLALLGGLCLFLSAIEYLIPRPLPFMRIGLANLPLLLALDIFGPKDFFLLALLKVLGQGIIGGALFSYVFLFSLAGTFASASVMYLLRRLLGKKHLGFTGLGCAGAMASNGVQLVLARYFIFGPALRFIVPPFLASGFVTGAALGLFCEYFSRHSLWYAKHAGLPANAQADAALEFPPGKSDAEAFPGTSAAEPRRLSRSLRWNRLFSAGELFTAGLAMALVYLFSRPLPGRVIHFVFFCLLAWFSGKKTNPIATALIMAGIVFFNLLAPYGKVLAALGPLRITQGSLLAGLEKAVTLEGLVMLSRACIKPDLRLPGALGSLLGESLRMLELMRQRKGMIGRKNIIGGIDGLLLEMEKAGADGAASAPGREQKRNVKGVLILCAMTAFTAAVWFVMQG